MSKWEAMGMLVTKQWMDKLAASHTIFKSCGMLKCTCLSDVLHKLHMLFNSTLTPLLTDELIGQKQPMTICADNSQDNIPMDDNEGGDDKVAALLVTPTSTTMMMTTTTFLLVHPMS